MIRSLIALVVLGGLTWSLHQEQLAGRFQRVDEGFEDFLIANTRERFDLGSSRPEGEVVYVGMAQEAVGEFESWPPPPLDWQMVIQALQSYEPEVLVVCVPLNWGRPGPEFVGAVGDALLPFPSVVQAVEAATSREVTVSFLGDLAERLPRFERVTGAGQAVEVVRALVTAPDPRVGVHGELGLRTEDWTGGAYAYPVMAGESQLEWVPSLLAQTLSRLEKAPYGEQRMRLGVGAGVHVGRGLFVPLTAEGRVPEVDEGQVGVTRVNALDLMTGGLVEALGEKEKASLAGARVVVVGLEEAQRKDSLWADQLARIVALPRVQRLPTVWQWGVWGVAVGVGVWMAGRVRRGKALVVALACIFVALTGSYLLFQSQLMWCPPAVPAAILLAAGVLTLVIGRRAVAAGREGGGVEG